MQRLGEASEKAFVKLLEGEDTQYIGELAESYLRRYAENDNNDTVCGLHNRYGNLYIGNKPITIIGSGIFVDDEEYEGTPGLWELIVAKNPDVNLNNERDIENYASLMLQTSTLHRNYDTNNPTPKAARGKNGKKYLKIIPLSM